MSKYIDADKLKAEIERRIEKYRKDGFGCHANSLEHFRDDFLEPLSEEPVALNKADKIKQILRLSVEYYKQEVFGKFDTEDMTEEREEHRAKWILERLPNEPDSEDLEEEVKNYFQGYWPGTETAEQCNTDLHFTPLAIMRLARHFAKWGAEHLKK